jgi:hypothetical protein
MSRFSRNARRQVEDILSAGNCACPHSWSQHDEKGCHATITRFKCAPSRYGKGGHEGHTDKNGVMSCIFTLPCRCQYDPGKIQKPRYALLDSDKDDKPVKA